MVRVFRNVLLFASALSLPLLCGCSLPKKTNTPSPVSVVAKQEPLPPEETQELVEDVAGNWFYGNGLGDSAVKVGTVIAFPPYALVLAGNAVLSIAGYEQVGVSNFLPDEGSREMWGDVYDGVTAGPGRVTAAVAGKEFRTQEAAKKRLERYFVKEPVETASAATLGAY